MENTNDIEKEVEKNEAATAESPVTEAGQVDELKKAQDELAEAKDKYLRLYSEFENFRRRTAKEKIDMIQSANEGLLKNLLPVMDDFERAEKAFKDLNTKEAEGFLLIFNKYKKILEQSGAKVLDLKVGDDFNADTQEAITQIPAPSEELKGKVVDVVEKGYTLNEKVIRFAKVVVGS
ncbi:nucleotide exchange factor GrpE [Chryseotalea sanaruensis]|uniref:Protein GrpE n=1 Tax=Chryseotalea sanaruensis TaxID=2482724 RepID=A0A401UBB7_9BACT|nr:nucleotide exchange factor GrpE [Chryseotalea sanaruensis]GCC52179.1 nucleotide exchange factor GrpE [Chryseotalea sanaruensis]